MAKNGYEQVQNTPQKPAVISWESLRKLILSAQNESGRVFILRDTYLKGAERFTYISFKKEGDGIKVTAIDARGTVSTYSYVDFIQELKHTFGNYTYQALTFQERPAREKTEKEERKEAVPPQAIEAPTERPNLPSINAIRDARMGEIRAILNEATGLSQVDEETRRHTQQTKHKVLQSLSPKPLTRNRFLTIHDVVQSTSYVGKKSVPTTTIVLSGDPQDKKTAFLGRVVVETVKREAQAEKKEEAGRRVRIFWKEAVSEETRERTPEILVPIEDLYLKDEFIVEQEEKKQPKKPAPAKHVENLELTEKLNTLIAEIKNDPVPEGKNRGYWKNDPRATQLVELCRKLYINRGSARRIYEYLTDLGYTKESGGPLTISGVAMAVTSAKLKKERGGTKEKSKKETSPEIKEALRKVEALIEEIDASPLGPNGTRGFWKNDPRAIQIILLFKKISYRYSRKAFTLLHDLKYTDGSGKEMKYLSFSVAALQVSPETKPSRKTFTTQEKDIPDFSRIIELEAKIEAQPLINGTRGYWKNDENAIKLIQLYREAYKGYGFFDKVHKRLVQLGYTAENGTEIVNNPRFRTHASPRRINRAQTRTVKTSREKTPRRSKIHALDIPEVREVFEQQQRRREEERRTGIHHRQFAGDDGARMLIMIAKKHVGKYWASQSAKMLNELGFVTRNGNEINSLTLNQWLNRKTSKRNLVKKQPLTPVYAPPQPPKPSEEERAHTLRMQHNRIQGRIDGVRDREIKKIRAANTVKGKENKQRLEATLNTFESIVKDVALIIREGKVDEKKYTYKRPIRRIELSTESVKVPGNKFVMIPTITILVGPLTEESIAHRAAREMCEHLEREKNFFEDPQNPAGVARVVINWVGRFYRQEDLFMRGLGNSGFPILERYIQIPGLKNETITIPEGTY